jgi:hypothetical protein
VSISCTDEGGGVCAVRFDASAEEPNLVRAFALDIVVDNGAKIVDFDDTVNTDYIIYPGSIVITNGVVTSYGSAKADPNVFAGTMGLDPNSMTVEMGSLYAPATGWASPNKPATSGILFTFTVDKDCCVSISENAARGGIVMEDSSSPASNLPCPSCCCLSIIVDCMKSSHAAYNDWVGGANLVPPAPWAKPDCWCYKYQCRGDIDGKPIAPGVPMYVSLADLTILRSAVNKMYTDPLWPAGGICADLDMAPIAPGVPMRVSLADVTIIRQWINIMDVPLGTIPPCDGTHINFWITPP